jgi:hypothetical protein
MYWACDLGYHNVVNQVRSNDRTETPYFPLDRTWMESKHGVFGYRRKPTKFPSL